MRVQRTLYADDNSQQDHTHTRTHTHILMLVHTHTHTLGGQCFAQAAVCNYPVGLDFSGVSLVIGAAVIPFLMACLLLQKPQFCVLCIESLINKIKGTDVNV